jgi:hypothetical protein
MVLAMETRKGSYLLDADGQDHSAEYFDVAREITTQTQSDPTLRFVHILNEKMSS